MLDTLWTIILSAAHVTQYIIIDSIDLLGELEEIIRNRGNGRTAASAAKKSQSPSAAGGGGFDDVVEEGLLLDRKSVV